MPCLRQTSATFNPASASFTIATICVSVNRLFFMFSGRFSPPNNSTSTLSHKRESLQKGFNGLHALVTEKLGEDPRTGALFVFTDRRCNRLKILFCDRTGLWVCTKRLEEGTFSWPHSTDSNAAKLELTPEALSLLTDGVDLRGPKLRPWYQRDGDE